MRLFRRYRYRVIDPALGLRNGGLVIGQATDRAQAYELAAAFGPGLWVVKTR